MTKPYHWENPVRTGQDDDAPTLDARTHTPDPAAVERLKQLMAGRRGRLARLHHRLLERNQRRAAARVWVDDVKR